MLSVVLMAYICVLLMALVRGYSELLLVKKLMIKAKLKFTVEILGLGLFQKFHYQKHEKKLVN